MSQFDKKKKIGFYFSEYEVFHSNTAVERGIDNSTINPIVWLNIRNTADRMDEIRERHGKPIIVNSWYRSLALNKALGSEPSSQHTKGQAVDFRSSAGREGTLDLFKQIMKKHTFDQMIYYPDSDGYPKFIHVSLIPNEEASRGEILTFKNGSYFPFDKNRDLPMTSFIAKAATGLGIIGLLGLGTYVYSKTKN